MEGVLILAYIAAHWKLALPANAPKELPMQPAVSLRPRGGVRLQIDRRKA